MCNVNEYLINRRGQCEHHYEEVGDINFKENDIPFSLGGLRLHQECFNKFMHARIDKKVKTWEEKHDRHVR